MKLLADEVSRAGEVFNSRGVGKSPERRGTPYQASMGRKKNPFRQIPRRDTPVVGRNAAASGQRNTHVYCGVERRQSLVHDRQRRRGPRPRQNPKTKQCPSKQPNHSPHTPPPSLL